MKIIKVVIKISNEMCKDYNVRQCLLRYLKHSKIKRLRKNHQNNGDVYFQFIFLFFCVSRDKTGSVFIDFIHNLHLLS